MNLPCSVNTSLTPNSARSQDPSKPPQQRLNIRHIHDPYSSGNRLGGPSSVVHKHSKAVAFSIFRDYTLLSRSTAAGNTSSIIGPAAHRPMAAQTGGIMLAPKKVQEQYTSTRTTSKLTTHGLLGPDEPRSDRSSTTVRPNAGAVTVARKEHQEKKEKEIKKKEKEDKKRREKEEKDAKKAKSKKGQQQKSEQPKSVDPESADSSSTAHSIVTSSTKVEGKQRRHSVNQVRDVVVSRIPSDQPHYDPPASPATLASVSTASTFTLKKHASFESSLSSTDGSATTVRADPPGVQQTEPLPAPSQEPVPYIHADVDHDHLDEEDDGDGDDDISPPITRTPHAEAFEALDPNTIEYVRGRGTRGLADGHNVHWAKRWFPPFGRPAKANAYGPTFPGPSSAVIESTYIPPWMTIAGRSAQESNERLIQNLNDSFKDVGLVHSRPNKPVKKKKRPTWDLFNEVPEDALYMLLPLWAQETDEASLNNMRADTAFPSIAVDERQYLLVYYDSFGERAPTDAASGSAKKKNKRSSPQSSLEPMDPKTVILNAFKVSARLVGYAELKGTGVRLPNTGLSVTGPPREAIDHMPPLLPSASHLPPEKRPRDFTIIAHCYGREKGVVFEPMGLEKLGLCMPRAPEEEEVQSESDVNNHWAQYDEPVEQLILLTPIGRAAVEMVWLGCLAMTSFGAM